MSYITAAVEAFLFGKKVPEQALTGFDNVALCYRVLQCLATNGKTLPTTVKFVVLTSNLTNLPQVKERLWPYATVARSHPCYDYKLEKYFEK